MGDVELREPTTSFSVQVGANKLTLLADGPERLEALLALIQGAKHELRILYYMFKDDAAGHKVRDALREAGERGVQVSVLVDGFGSQNVAEGFFKALNEGNCRFCRFEPRWGRRYLLRNHQKLALADRELVIAGGFNITDEYFGSAESGAWRDLGVQVHGPGAECLADYFDDLFGWARKRNGRIRDLRRMLARHSQRQGNFRWLLGGPTRRLSPWARAVKRDMLRARSMDLVAAYFAPSRSLLRKIGLVGRRGRARVITAAKSDNGATVGAARHTYSRLLKRGVEIYEYQPTKLHTKLIIVDDIVHIGSANFDMRSLYLNLEMMLRIDDVKLARAMRRLVDHEVADSLRITREMHDQQRSWFNRVKWGLCYFFVATMDYSVSRRLNFGIDAK